MLVCIEFDDEQRAMLSEPYLKTASSSPLAFRAVRHPWRPDLRTAFACINTNEPRGKEDRSRSAVLRSMSTYLLWSTRFEARHPTTQRENQPPAEQTGA